MIRPSILRARPYTAPKLKSNDSQNPFHPYDATFLQNLQNETETDFMITQQKSNPTFVNSFYYGNSNPQTFVTILQNNCNRGLRNGEKFKKFRDLLKRTAKKSKIEWEASKNLVKEIENSKNAPIIEKKNSSKKKEFRLTNTKNIEKNIKNLAEKHNNKTTLNKINVVMQELYEERKKTKKIVKYMDSHKPSKSQKDSRIATSMKISQIKTKKSDSLENSQTNILEAYQNPNTPFIPKAVIKALDQLKNFIIDVPLLDDDKWDENHMNRNTSTLLKKENDSPKASFCFHKTSKLKPGLEYKNEKHLKDDFKMFKGKNGNKLIRKFTDMANEEAHEKEMSYYLSLLRLKNVSLNEKSEKNENSEKNEKNEKNEMNQVYNFNDELRKIYKKETLIRNHGRIFKRKFLRLKNDMNKINKEHFVNIDKLEVKIHRGLMNDYKRDEKKIISDLVEKMKPQLTHKNTL